MPDSFTSTSFTSTSYTVAAAGPPGIISFASQQFPRLIRTDYILSRSRINQIEKIKVLKNIPISKILKISILKTLKVSQEQKIQLKRTYNVSSQDKLRVQLPHRIKQFSSLFVRKKQSVMLSTVANIGIIKSLNVEERQSIPIVKLAQINRYGTIEVIDPKEIVSAIQAIQAIEATTLGSAGEDERWITTDAGAKVLIKEGETIEEAFARRTQEKPLQRSSTKQAARKQKEFTKEQINIKEKYEQSKKPNSDMDLKEREQQFWEYYEKKRGDVLQEQEESQSRMNFAEKKIDGYSTRLDELEAKPEIKEKMEQIKQLKQDAKDFKISRDEADKKIFDIVYRDNRKDFGQTIINPEWEEHRIAIDELGANQHILNDETNDMLRREKTFDKLIKHDMGIGLNVYSDPTLKPELYNKVSEEYYRGGYFDNAGINNGKIRDVIITENTEPRFGDEGLSFVGGSWNPIDKEIKINNADEEFANKVIPHEFAHARFDAQQYTAVRTEFEKEVISTKDLKITPYAESYIKSNDPRLVTEQYAALRELQDTDTEKYNAVKSQYPKLTGLFEKMEGEKT